MLGSVRSPNTLCAAKLKGTPVSSPSASLLISRVKKATVLKKVVKNIAFEDTDGKAFTLCQTTLRQKKRDVDYFMQIYCKGKGNVERVKNK